MIYSTSSTKRDSIGCFPAKKESEVKWKSHALTHSIREHQIFVALLIRQLEEIFGSPEIRSSIFYHHH